MIIPGQLTLREFGQENISVEARLSYNKTTGKFRFGDKESIPILPATRHKSKGYGDIGKKRVLGYIVKLLVAQLVSTVKEFVNPGHNTNLMEV